MTWINILKEIEIIINSLSLLPHHFSFFFRGFFSSSLFLYISLFYSHAHDGRSPMPLPNPPPSSIIILKSAPWCICDVQSSSVVIVLRQKWDLRAPAVMWVRCTVNVFIADFKVYKLFDIGRIQYNYNWYFKLYIYSLKKVCEKLM